MVDGNSGTIAVGQRVIGAGISDGDVVVKVVTVTDQNNLVLDKAIKVADDAQLAFTTDANVEAKGEEYEVTAVSSNTLTIKLLDDPNGA